MLIPTYISAYAREETQPTLRDVMQRGVPVAGSGYTRVTEAEHYEVPAPHNVGDLLRLVCKWDRKPRTFLVTHVVNDYTVKASPRILLQRMIVEEMSSDLCELDASNKNNCKNNLVLRKAF